MTESAVFKLEKSSAKPPRPHVRNVFSHENRAQISEQRVDKGTVQQMNQDTTDFKKSTYTQVAEKQGNTSSLWKEPKQKPLPPSKPWTTLHDAENQGNTSSVRNKPMHKPLLPDRPWTILPGKDPLRMNNLDRDREHPQASGHHTATKNIQSCGSINESIMMLLCRLGLENNINEKLMTADFLQISNPFPKSKKSETQLVRLFMQRLMAVDYRARNKEDVKSVLSKKQDSIHLMDIQMALYLCADDFLRQTMVTKLSECQYAVPLLVPHPFSRKIEFPLWTLRKITKKWKTRDHTGRTVTVQNQPMYKAETPMVAFLRFGSVSSSKSQLINILINEKHKTFFHRNCLGNSKTRLLVDGLVEISWYCPSGNDTDYYNDCVAFCNLHGDASVNQTQREILISSASVVVVFLPDRKMYTEVKDLCGATKSQILILTKEEDDNEDAAGRVQGARVIGLKGGNMHDVAFDVRHIIKNYLEGRRVTFRIETLPMLPGVILDEDDNRCRKEKRAAEQVVNFLYTVPSKEAHLPCQGQLWHDWCQKNKELRQVPNITAEEISRRHHEMREIRCKQLEHGMNELMRIFIESMVVLLDSAGGFFLKWMEILLDELNSKQHNASECRLEHLVREMGQLYEASVSGTVNPAGYTPQIYTHLPTLAAKILISGHQLELMDGDASYVPLTWMSAVLDEVIKILGDRSVFVLSVLGIQSSGKSTMLNALFGFQFKVNAGQCTRGAFMQMVDVSEEMKSVMGADYILVIDTEGLRAPYSSTSHDNELATFVVGIGNMTLINILGENTCEMQEILQIVVHAFLRMKKIQLKPCCMFVHQNVSDIAARDKTKKERTYLKDMLDETTQLTAQGESIFVEDFNDVIEFDEHNDVKYFPSYWEGSPPMAPPNPTYSQCIQELKQNIISHAKKANSLTLSQFRKQVKDIWEALLNENFVFSFRNAREISVYRKLEHESGNWAWSLRSAMLNVEFKMLNRVAGGVLDTVQGQELKNEMAATWNQVENDFDSYFEKSNNKQILSHWKGKFKTQLQHLHEDLIEGTKRKVNDAIQLKAIRKMVEQQWQNFERETFERCRGLALKLKGNVNSEDLADREFDAMWKNLASKLTEHVPVIKDIDLLTDMTEVLGEMYSLNLANERKALSEYKTIVKPKDYKRYVKRSESMKIKPIMSSSLSFLKPVNHRAIQSLIFQVIEQIKTTVELFQLSVHGYNLHYIHLMAKEVRSALQNFESSLWNHSRASEEGFNGLSKEFYVDLSFYVCEQSEMRIVELHRQYKEANDPHIYLQRKKTFYFNIFHKFWKGAASAAIIGAQICTRLKEPILQSVYNRMANFVCEQMRGKPPFNGNRADLEKYILKSLAEQTGPKLDRFNKYLMYMYTPLAHFKNFIVERVRDFMATENPRAVSEIKECIDSKLRAVIGAALKATTDVKDNKWNTNMWLRLFSQSLADELGDTRIQNYDDEDNNTDYNILVDVIKNELPSVALQLQKTLTTLSDIKMEDFRERPDDILIQHFCVCCWEQCPFCGAVCTNSQKDHPGDHNADFHRTASMNGVYHNDSTEFFIDFCTTAVASNDLFSPKHSKLRLPFKNYRSAGGKYSKWRISTDLSELAYWKWFLCEFQEDLEMYHKMKFQGYGKIHDEWKHYNLQNAIASLGLC